jgi:hypothetical protein
MPEDSGDPADNRIETESGVVIQYDPAADGAVLASRIVGAMAEVTDRDRVDIEPLGSTLDTDALATLFCDPPPAGAHASVSLKFTHDDCEILVTENHRIAVQPLD